MKLSVILAHPNQQSFNHAIANTTVTTLQQNGHEVIFHDLYAEKFDPLLPDEEIPTEAALIPELEKHCQEITSADGIIIVHPNWWGGKIVFSTCAGSRQFTAECSVWWSPVPRLNGLNGCKKFKKLSVNIFHSTSKQGDNSFVAPAGFDNPAVMAWIWQSRPSEGASSDHLSPHFGVLRYFSTEARR